MELGQGSWDGGGKFEGLGAGSRAVGHPDVRATSWVEVGGLSTFQIPLVVHTAKVLVGPHKRRAGLHRGEDICSHLP